jgi:hypothetical protein
LLQNLVCKVPWIRREAGVNYLQPLVRPLTLVELHLWIHLPSVPPPLSGIFPTCLEQKPGALYGGPKNSTPATAKALISANKVLTYPEGTPFMDPILFIVALPTLERSTKSAELHLSNALSAPLDIAKFLLTTMSKGIMSATIRRK